MKWTLRNKINPDLYGVLYRKYLRFLVGQSVNGTTPYGMECHKSTADKWAREDIKDKRDCLKSIVKRGKYIIVKNHDRWLVYMR
jgi:hypothetical protein